MTRTIGKLEIAIGGFGRNTIHMHVTVKDHIYEYALTNTDNELYCYSNEFHSHLLFDRPWIDFNDLISCTSLGGINI